MTSTTSSEETHEPAISNVETEYQEINSTSSWSSFYQDIRNESGNYEYTSNESKKPQNRSLNRYRDVTPYDHTRIILKRGSCDYIHANLVKVEHAHRQYILTQGPLPNTCGHFWLMVWEQNCKAVIMLNKIIEKSQIKCHQYWPMENFVDPTMTFEEVNIKVEYLSKVEKSDYTIRTLCITDLETGDTREVLHFHYITWPDFGVPQCPRAFLRFLIDVRRSRALNQNVGPPVVHCSAGIGRSGTFCLVDTCLVLIEEKGLNSVNVRDILMEMRRSRMGLIQTSDQLRFSYTAIIEGAKQLPFTNVNFENIVAMTNHYDIANDINNSTLLDDDELPPLPPLRLESLTRSINTGLPSEMSTENDQSNGPPDKPLPREPPTCTEPSTSPPSIDSTSIENNVYDEDSVAVSDEIISDNAEKDLQMDNPPSTTDDSKKEVRRRHREKNERLATQVREMKRRQKETEEWQTFKRSKSETTECSETMHEEPGPRSKSNERTTA